MSDNTTGKTDLKLSLLHGWGMNRALFEPLIGQIDASISCHAIDLPGHGRSELAASDFDAGVEWLATQLENSFLLGWSMGGLYAIELVRRFPERFSGLILIAFNPCFVRAEGWDCAVERSVFEEFSASLGDDWQATIKRFLGLQLHGIEQARRRIRELSGMLFDGGAPRPDALEQGLEILLTRDARADLAALDLPMLLILGQRDTLVPISLQQQIYRVNPRIRVESVARSAHVPFVTHAEAVAQRICEFTQSTKTR